MKKTKFLALALAAGIMMMGAGYAAWTDDITSTSTIKTGNFAVDVLDSDCHTKVFVIDKDIEGNPNNAVGHWETVKEENNDYKISAEIDKDKTKDSTVGFKFGNLFPGTVASSCFTFQNKGTVPASIGSVNVTVKKNGEELSVDNTDPLYNAIEVYNDFFIKGDDGLERVNNGARWVSLPDLSQHLTDTLVDGNIIVKSGEALTTKDADGKNNTWFKIPTEALKGDNGENLGINDNIEVEIKFNFEQSNLVEKK